eukprot:3933430-Rhodomonas_salina.3
MGQDAGQYRTCHGECGGRNSASGSATGYVRTGWRKGWEPGWSVGLCVAMLHLLFSTPPLRPCRIMSIQHTRSVLLCSALLCSDLKDPESGNAIIYKRNRSGFEAQFRF